MYKNNWSELIIVKINQNTAQFYRSINMSMSCDGCLQIPLPNNQFVLVTSTQITLYKDFHIARQTPFRF